MADKRFLAACLGALALSGCISLGNEKPPPVLLTLTPAATVAANTERTAAAGTAITVVVPTVPQALQTLRVPVQASPTTIAYIVNAQWIEQPNKLFQHLLSETIAARTGRVVLDPHQTTLDPGIRLTGTLQSFGLDAASGQATVVYDAELSRDNGATVDTKRFSAQVPATARPQAVATALNAAANQVAAAVADWVGGR
jgi:cholesterol transport system auxiliary component